MERYEREPDCLRRIFQICLSDDAYVGWVNAYSMDNPPDDAGENALAIGIDIPVQSARRKGVATEAWVLVIKYLRERGMKIYTETWPGNYRLLGLAEKLGFRECRRRANVREVRGEKYDALCLVLDEDLFDERFGAAANS